MPRSSSSTGRRTRGRRAEGLSVASRVFEVVAHPIVIAGALLLAALLCVLAAGLDGIDLFSKQSWSAPQVKPEMARGVAIVFGAGLLGAGGLFFERQRLLAAKKLMTLAMLSLGLGASLIIADWLLAHRALPAGELVLAVNKEQESYEIHQGGRALSVMLPLRMTLRGITVEDEPSAKISFSRPGQQGVSPRTFVPGQSLDVEGLRFTFVGLVKGTTGFQAILSSDEEQTIDAVAVPGEVVKFGLEGPQYRLEEATENYRDLLGPAVKLVDEKGQSFWVFARNSQKTQVPHGLRLKALEQVPAAMMVVSAVRPEWPFMLGLALLLGGAALFFFAQGAGGWPRSSVLGLVATAPVAVAITFGFGVVRVGLSLSATTEGGLAMLSALGWVLALAALLGAGAQAELASPRGRGGVLTAGIAALATAMAIVVVGVLRGRIGQTSFGLPLTADGAPAMWGLEQASNLGPFKLPIVADGNHILGLLAGMTAAIVVGIGAAFWRKEKAALIGWSLAALQSLGAALSLSTSQIISVESISLETQRLMALQYLRAQNLPPALADRGAILATGEVAVDRLALLPEIGAFLFVASLGGVAAFMTWKKIAAPGEESVDCASPGLFASAVIFATIGWAFGLILTLSQLGSPGILAPMEWLGLSVPSAALGLLIAGCGDDESPLRRYLKLAGPALALVWLILVLAAGAAAATLPGASISLI